VKIRGEFGAGSVDMGLWREKEQLLFASEFPPM